jgi:cell shape-determining protein MreD
MRRTLVLFATLLLLWALLAELNHALSPLHVWVFAGGLYVGHAALHQSQRGGLALALLAGCLCDAATPVAFGTHALLFTAAQLVVFRLRDRIPRQDNVAATLVALFTNFALYLLLAFTQGHQAPAGAWPRLLADLVCSQVFVALVTPWFFALQARAVALADAFADLRAGREA